MANKNKRYINREISWLHFNHRVLQEAGNPAVPLVERLRFLGIYSNNLDEFFRVRVATLQRLIDYKGDTKPFYPDNPQKVVKEIKTIVNKHQREFDLLYNNILNELNRKRIYLINETQLNDEQKDYVFQFYNNQLVNSLNPIMISRIETFPELTDANIYFIVKLQNDNKKEYALVMLPISDFTRFVVLPNSNGKKYVMLLDDVVRLCLPKLFSSLNYRQFDAYSIKMTRDAEMDLEQEISGNFLDKIVQGVKNRSKGNPVRLNYDARLPKSMLKYLVNKLNIRNSSDTLAAGNRYHNFKDFMSFPNLGNASLLYQNWIPAPLPVIDNSNNILKLIVKQDVFLHCPYHSFSHYIRLLREAAIDPDVKSIKTTMYRLANNSKIVKALINAARNGKKVTAVIELLARFDESANIIWAQRMQEAGIKVIFGVEGLKIHSKLTYINRKSGDIACVGTGNFHEGNAKVYTDIFLMTANKRLVKEIADVFNFINQPFHNTMFSSLMVSPQQMRKKLMALIKKEMANAQAQKPAYIIGKINHITDSEIINKLYDAAKAGVKIQLIVRGNCCMVESKNITIVSIVDRYLEHSRIFFFANGGNELAYISSADWMTRNFDHRIEVAVPIHDPKIRAELKFVIECGLNDNVKARIVNGSGKNALRHNQAPDFRSQWELYKHYNKISTDNISNE